MERMYEHEDDTQNRKEVQPDVHQEVPNVPSDELTERGSGRGCRRRSRRHSRRRSRRRSHRRSRKRSRRGSKRKEKCICKPRRRRKRRRQILSNNPFLIFYLEMYFKNPTRHVTEVAREAGKKWCSMSEKSRMKYIRLAAKVRCRCPKKK